MSADVTCAIDCKNELGECPLWSPKDNVLWWIDVAKPTLWRFDPARNTTSSWPLPKPPTVLALRENGGLLIIFRKGYALVDALEPGMLIEQQHELDLAEERFNDGKVDRLGRMWVGTMDRKLKRPIGQLYRLSLHQPVQAVDRGFVLSNGIGWNSESTLMYFAETHSKNIYVFDYDLQNAMATNRRVFANTAGEGGPDGLTVDAHGNVWVAVFGGGAIYQYAPDGQLIQKLAVPTAHPTSCTFGGPDLRTLYITSSRMSLEGEASTGTAHAGGVWAVQISNSRGQIEAFLAE